MDYRKQLIDNITTVQRNIVALKEGIMKFETSKGQVKFLNTYITVVNDYIKRSVEVLDIEKYREMLEELDEEGDIKDDNV